MKSFYDHPSDADFFTPDAQAQAIADKLRQITSPDDTRAVISQWSQAAAFNLLGVPAESPSHKPHLQAYQQKQEWMFDFLDLREQERLVMALDHLIEKLLEKALA